MIRLLLSVLIAFPSYAGQTGPVKLLERDYVSASCEGQTEYPLPDGTRVDCLTDTHAIEYDKGSNWAEALGQALFYSAMTGKKAGIVLITNPNSKARFLKRLEIAIAAHDLKVDVFTLDK